MREVLTIMRQNVQVKEINLRLFKAYVDDEFVVSTAIGPGWRYDKDNQRMLWRKETDLEDKDVPSDLLTARVITEISNDLDVDIKMTLDCPSNNADGRMPVLDLKAWMEKDNGKCCIKPLSTKRMCPANLLLGRILLSPGFVRNQRYLGKCSEDCIIAQKT